MPDRRTDAVILACAISAGIHAALAPEHFRETTAAGVAFAASAVLLAGLAAVLTSRPSDAALTATAVVFSGLIGSYALAVTTGFPVFHPDVDPVGGRDGAGRGADQGSPDEEPEAHVGALTHRHGAAAQPHSHSDGGTERRRAQQRNGLAPAVDSIAP